MERESFCLLLKVCNQNFKKQTKRDSTQIATLNNIKADLATTSAFLQKFSGSEH